MIFESPWGNLMYIPLEYSQGLFLRFGNHSKRRFCSIQFSKALDRLLNFAMPLLFIANYLAGLLCLRNIGYILIL